MISQDTPLCTKAGCHNWPRGGSVKKQTHLQRPPWNKIEVSTIVSPEVSPGSKDKDAVKTPLQWLRCVSCFSLVLMFLLFGFSVETFFRECRRQRPALGKLGRLELWAQHRQRRAHKDSWLTQACSPFSLTNSLNRYSWLNTTLPAYPGGSQTRHTVFLYEACGPVVKMTWTKISVITNYEVCSRGKCWDARVGEDQKWQELPKQRIKRYPGAQQGDGWSPKHMCVCVSVCVCAHMCVCVVVCVLCVLYTYVECMLCMACLCFVCSLVLSMCVVCCCKCICSGKECTI